MSTEVQKVLDDLHSTWHEMKQALDAKGQQDAEQKQYVDRLNNHISDLEKKHSELEEKLTNPRQGKVVDPSQDEDNGKAGKSANVKASRAAFRKACEFGVVGLDTAERKSLEPTAFGWKAMALADDSTGGFLAYPELVLDILKNIVLFSPIRTVATVRQTSNRSVKQPVRTGTISARWVGEVQQRNETPGLKYGMEDVPNHELYAEVIVSIQDLEDSAFDLEGEIIKAAGEQFGVAEGQAFVYGDAVNKPEGFMTNAAVQTQVTTLGTGSMTPEGIIQLYYDLPDFYAQNATWLMKRASVGEIRKMRAASGTGDFLWEHGFEHGSRPTILGLPYVECPDMQVSGTNQFPVALGDFSRGYVIVDRVNIQVKRLEEKYAETGQVALLVRKRVGGQVILAEAIRLGKTL